MKIDLVSMASHGESGVRRALDESVTAEVIRHANCPLLVWSAEPQCPPGVLTAEPQPSPRMNDSMCLHDRHGVEGRGRGSLTYNVQPLLHEIRHALARLLDDGGHTVIDLRSLPLAPGEEEQLA